MGFKFNYLSNVQHLFSQINTMCWNPSSTIIVCNLVAEASNKTKYKDVHTLNRFMRNMDM